HTLDWRIPRAESCATANRSPRPAPCRAQPGPRRGHFANAASAIRRPHWGPTLSDFHSNSHESLATPESFQRARALRKETARVTRKTRTPTFKYTPGSISDAVFVIISSPHRVMITAITPPQKNSKALSVSSCRIMRPRVQPSAARTAISLWRFTPRASKRLATLAHAIRSTTPDATAVIHKPRWAFCGVGPG